MQPSKGRYRAARASAFLTCTCVHLPPRAVGTLRSFKLLARALWLVTPPSPNAVANGASAYLCALAYAWKRSRRFIEMQAVQQGLDRATPLAGI